MKTSMIWQFDETVVPKQSKTHRVHVIDLPYPVESLEIAFGYSPKTLDDEQITRELVTEALPRYRPDMILQGEDWRKLAPLQNLLTLSIDDPAGFRGAAHRHDLKQLHVLSEGYASPGFQRGAIAAGRWTLTVSLHCIVTAECHYHLRVSELQKPAAEVGLR